MPSMRCNSLVATRCACDVFPKPSLTLLFALGLRIALASQKPSLRQFTTASLVDWARHSRLVRCINLRMAQLYRRSLHYTSPSVILPVDPASARRSQRSATSCCRYQMTPSRTPPNTLEMPRGSVKFSLGTLLYTEILLGCDSDRGGGA